MNTKAILIASLAALTLGAGMPSLAATHAQGQTPSSSGMSSDQAAPQHKPGGPMMDGGMMGRGMMGGGMGGMMGGGMGDMMNSGMAGMMGGCHAAMDTGLDRKTAMQMHGEMMRAMGDILVKYADKVTEPAPKH